MLDCGEVPVNCADCLNFPYAVAIEPANKKGRFRLSAHCLQRRKGRIIEDAFVAYGTREELADAVREHWLPLWQTGTDSLVEVIENRIEFQLMEPVTITARDRWRI